MSQAIIWRNTAVHWSVTISKSWDLSLDLDSQEYCLSLMSFILGVVKLEKHKNATIEWKVIAVKC